MFQLGIDVSKKTLDLCLLREGVKGRVKNRKLKNNFNAASAVISWLSKQHCEPADIHIIMEATGVYHESLANGLYKAGARVSLANPHRSREFARGMDILTKNDQVDAYMLACYGALKEPEPWEPPQENVRYLSALLRRRDALVTDSSREKNRLEKCRATDTPPVVTGVRLENGKYPTLRLFSKQVVVDGQLELISKRVHWRDSEEFLRLSKLSMMIQKDKIPDRYRHGNSVSFVFNNSF